MLRQLALIGTANSPATLPDLPDEVRTLLPETEFEQQLLLAAGMLTVYREAGRLPVTLKLPEAAEEESANLPSEQVQAILDECLKGEWAPWWPRVAERLARHQYTIRPERLVLTLKSVKPDEAARWRPLIGTRGRWLAAQKKDWGWVLADAPVADLHQQWQEGSTEQRSAALHVQRAQDAALARSWLEESWKSEKADTRQPFLAILTTGLSLDDQPFLNTCLSDRSQAVRSTAAALLAMLPQSGLALQLTERAKQWVSWEAAQGALSKMAGKFTGSSGSLKIEPAAEWDQSWAKEGFADTPPAGEGVRSFWLRQLVSLTPPSLWQEHTGQNADTFIRAALASDWGQAMAHGLLFAIQRFRDADWALAFYRAQTTQPEKKRLQADDLLPLIHPAEREALCLEQLKHDACSAGALLAACPHPWPQALNDAVQRATRDALRLAARNAADALRCLELTAQAALNLPSACLEKAGGDWQEAITALEAQSDNWAARNAASQLAQQLELTRRRIQFDKEIAP